MNGDLPRSGPDTGAPSARRPVARVRELTDEVLVLRWQRGDLAAASIAIQRYERMVYGAALRVLRDPHRAEDAAQETFIRAHERIDSLREPGALPGWLKQICVRLSIDEVRRQRPASLDEDELDVPDERPGPAAAAETADALERFRAALHELPESLRLIVSLRDVEGLSTAEAAASLEISEAAVKMRLSRGRKLLRAMLRPATAGKLRPPDSNDEATL